MALTKDQLKELKVKLKAERKRILELSGDVKNTVDVDLSEDPDGPSYGNSLADMGTDLFEREQALGLEQDLQVRIEEIDRALRKMDDGTYGVSEQSGKPIPVGRLRIVPWARYLVDESGD